MNRSILLKKLFGFALRGDSGFKIGIFQEFVNFELSVSSITPQNYLSDDTTYVGVTFFNVM